jgi:chromosome segregation ATPase
MDEPHLSSQMEYLEQRHQEDQLKIAELQQRIEAQEYELQEQTHRVRKIEDQLADTKLTLSRVPLIDERVDRMKNEILQLMEERFGGAQPGTTAASANLSSQLDNHAKTLNELRREMDKTRRFDEQFSLVRTDAERVNKTVSAIQADLDKVQKQVEERVRAARYLEEQRAADARRLAELQTEIPVLHKKTEATQSKLQLLEQQMPQFGKYEIALEEVREEIRRHREHMDFQSAQRERQMKTWSDLGQDMRRQLDEYKGLMEKYAQHYQLNKRALASLQEFQERLQREQHQAEELQRLAEERQRADMEKLQANYGQQWQKQNMEWKTQADGLLKDMVMIQERIEKISEFNQTMESQLNLILQIIEEDVQARAMAAQEWQEHFEQLADGQA